MSVIEKITERERAYLEEVLSYGFRSSKGSVLTNRLEKAFAENMKAAEKFSAAL